MIFQVVTLRSMICLVAGRPRDSLLSGENGKGGINTPSMYIYIYTYMCDEVGYSGIYKFSYTQCVCIYIYYMCVGVFFLKFDIFLFACN